ncbi:hypothetical protein NC651_027663 [Populus alba x Populus x berolinensis]|nr:hypothetical protein NC651_027663 [Populus alba x Populus x berolinensis]
MKTREWDKVRVQLSWEAKAACDTTHGGRNEMVKIPNWNMAKQNISSQKTLSINLQVGVASLRVRKQMSYKASLSKTMHSSAFSTSWWTERVALYGSTTVSDTLGEGKTENVNIMRSGYSSRILEIRRVPMPEPVPPPNEWQT